MQSLPRPFGRPWPPLRSRPRPAWFDIRRAAAAFEPLKKLAARIQTLCT